MPKARKFPEHVFVAYSNGGQPAEAPWLIVSDAANDAIEDDGPSRVATYKLVEVNELSKRVVSKSSR